MPDQTEQDTRPGILVVTRNYPPLVGGMERLLHQAVDGLCEHAKVTLIGPTGCGRYAPEGADVYEVPAGLAGFLALAGLRIVLVGRRGRFDLVLGGSGLTAPLLRLARFLAGARSALFVHGLDLVVDNRLYQALFLPAIARADLVIANSQNTRLLAVERGVACERLAVINPGTEIPGEIPEDMIQAFRQSHDLGQARIVLFVGRMTRRKGLSRFIEEGFPHILEREPDTCLVVAGDNPDQGLTRLEEQDDVLASVVKLGLEKQVRFLARVDDDELTAAYAAADVHVFPLVDVPGDVEGFGMVAIEAAAHGTATVAFDTGGVRDAVSHGSGILVASGRYDLFAEAVLDVMNSGLPTHRQCVEHARRYSWDNYHKRLVNTLALV